MTRPLRSAALAVVAALALAGLTGTPARAGTGQAVVIVDTGSGTYTRVISFDGTISGYEALVLAGADPTTYGFAGQGVAICRLFGVGNQADDSCLGTGDDPRYWAYYRAPAGSGGWQYARGGAGATTVSDGDVEGWRFGTGGAPGYRAFCDVVGCAPAPAPAPAPDPAAAPGPTEGGATTAAGSTASPGSPVGGSAAPDVEPSGSREAAPATDGSGDPASTATTGPTAGGRGTTGARRDRSGPAGDQALGARPVVADDVGAGSPIGVLVTVVLVVLIVGAAVVLRRRGRSAD